MKLKSTTHLQVDEIAKHHSDILKISTVYPLFAKEILLECHAAAVTFISMTVVLQSFF